MWHILQKINELLPRWHLPEDTPTSNTYLRETLGNTRESWKGGEHDRGTLKSRT